MPRRALWRQPVLWLWLRGLAGLVALLAAAALVFAAVSIVGLGALGRDVTVPNVVAKPLAQAQDILKEKGLGSEVVARNYHPAIPQDQVISMQPHPYMRVRAGRIVALIVSSGPRRAEVPQVAGLALDDARNVVVAAGLTVGKISRRHSDESPDRVLSQSPAARQKVPRGVQVNLVVSGGPDYGQLKSASGQAILLRRVRVVVPEGPTVQRVRITLDEGAEPRAIYDRLHRIGDEIELNFKASRRARLYIYVDEKLVVRKRL